jgi:hypothetical protein
MSELLHLPHKRKKGFLPHMMHVTERAHLLRQLPPYDREVTYDHKCPNCPRTHPFDSIPSKSADHMMQGE